MAAARSSTSAAHAFEEPVLRLQLLGEEPPSLHHPESTRQWEYAQQEDRPGDPTALPAGNAYDWDYALGNPPNPPVQVDATSRPNNGTSVVVDTIVLLMFRGINTIGYVNRAWRATGGLYRDDIFRYKTGVEDPL